MLFFDGFEKGPAMLETGIGWVAAFGFVAHAGAVGAACVGCEVVGAGRMPIAIAVLVAIEARQGRMEITRPGARIQGRCCHHRSLVSSVERRCPCGPRRSLRGRSYRPRDNNEIGIFSWRRGRKRKQDKK